MTYINQTQTLYDDNAGHWVRTERTSLSDYTARPRVLDLCEPAAGRRVLDLGCGEGYCSRILRQRGAEVVGVDISPEMIARARQAEEHAPLGIEYEVGDAAQAAFSASTFDVVVAVFLFNYLNVDQMRQTMVNVHSMLRPGGSFVFSVPHPAFPFMRKAEPPFYFDVEGAGYFSDRNRLFPGRIWKRDGVALDVQLVHKTFEDYFDALKAAGFDKMPDLIELKVTQDMVDLDPKFFGPLLDFPLHVAMRIVR